MDPLSNVLSLLRPRSYMFRGFEAAAPWSLRYPPNDGIRCYAVVCGECWLVVDGTEGALRLTAGDCVVLTRGQPFCLSSDPALTPRDAVAFVSEARQGGVASLNGGGELKGLGGYFNFEGQHADVLLALLPPVLHVRKEADRATLRWSIETMMNELREPRPGGALVAEHLAHLVLVLALRLYLAEGPQARVGWLSALADRQLGAAINAIHAAPAQRWTLESLAECAGMSRSSFALRFREVVGEPPMEHLARWRMLLAADKLSRTGESISQVAWSVGYESDSAFSAAFRRIMGCAPRQFARARNLPAPS